MDTLRRGLDFVGGQEPLSSLVLVGLLIHFGARVVRHDESARRLGQLAAALTLALVLVADLAEGTSPLHVAGRGLILSGLVLGVSWLVLPAARGVSRRTVDPLVRAFRTAGERARERRAARREEVHRVEARSRETEAWERAAPEREREQEEAAARRDEELRARKRRDDARFQCLLYHSRHAEALAAKVSRKTLDAFLARYLSDEVDPEIVEQRAAQLCENLRECLHGSRAGGTAFATLDDLADHFRRQRDQVAALPFPDDARESLLTTIARAEEAAIQEFFQS